MGGCLTSIIPLIIMMGIYYSVVNPLQNTLHIAGSKVTERCSCSSRCPAWEICSAAFTEKSIL